MQPNPRILAADALGAFANGLDAPAEAPRDRTIALASLPVLRAHAEATLHDLADSLPLGYEQGLATGQALCCRELTDPIARADVEFWRRFYGPAMLRGWAEAWRAGAGEERAA